MIYGEIRALRAMQEQSLDLKRNLLKDQAAEVLRDYISDGRLPEGSKVTERDIANLLGSGRAPARDALMALEAEGLVVSRPDGRYVFELTDDDACEITEIRIVLERLAIERAAANISEDDRVVLYGLLHQMEEAAANGDSAAFAKHDIALHRTIWRQAQSPNLLRILGSVLGTIFILTERYVTAGGYNFEHSLKTHRELLDSLCAGDGVAAANIMEKQHMGTLTEIRKGRHLGKNR